MPNGSQERSTSGGQKLDLRRKALLLDTRTERHEDMSFRAAHRRKAARPVGLASQCTSYYVEPIKKGSTRLL